MVEIKITYETLFDLLRREKNREELQALDKDFYEQVSAYLKEKESLASRKEDTSYFSSNIEKQKIQYQNIRRIIKELYERREKKIINIALVKARTGSDVIDTSPMLPCELEVFEDLVELFAKYKRQILDSVINLREFSGVARGRISSKITAMSDEEVSYEPSAYQNGDQPDVHFKTAPGGKGEDLSTKKIRILEYLPKFMGRHGEILGPYEKDAVVELDNTIAELLVRKGRAQPA